MCTVVWLTACVCLCVYAAALAVWFCSPLRHKDIVYRCWMWLWSSVSCSNADCNHFYQASTASTFNINCWSVLQIYKLSNKALIGMETSTTTESPPQLCIITGNIMLCKSNWSLAWWLCRGRSQAHCDRGTQALVNSSLHMITLCAQQFFITTAVL